MIALLSNVTIESLALRIKKENEGKGNIGIEIYTAPGFGSWKTELLTPSSALWKSGVKTVYVLLHGPALFPEKMDDPLLSQLLSGLLEILSQARREHGDKMFVVSTLDLPRPPAMPLIGKNFPARAAALWRGELEKMDVPVLDLAELAAETGRERFYSPKMWYFGSLPLSQEGETLLAREILRIENVLRGGRKKCLVLDLDNTLWGGVVGEDGIEGIALASTGMGSQYRDAQRIVKELSEQGVLLAVASKNDREDALRPFREHPHTLLKEDDFLEIKADWNPKPANIAAIAEKLNIGTDSLVFIDDNPVEREAVKAALPEAAVPEFPQDTSKLPLFMADVARTYFTALRIGGEDLVKTEMYRAEVRREVEKNAHLSLPDYLASLEMTLDFHRLRNEEVGRAAQLTQKTNQFNLTTKRRTEADITALLNDADARVWMAELRDRFGDYGRIALVIVRLEAKPLGLESLAVVENFLMSCRVMGRGAEEAILSGVERVLAAVGVTARRGWYLPTEKNGPVREFWDKMGYVLEGELEREKTEQTWIRHAPFPERRTKICLNC
jgi:FkbH-like protein